MSTILGGRGEALVSEKPRDGSDPGSQRPGLVSEKHWQVSYVSENRWSSACIKHFNLSCGDVKWFKRFMIVEGIRNNIRMNFPADYCTMKNSKEVCKIEYTFSNGTKGFKFPKLMELYEHLFPGIPAPQNLHNSFADTIITLKCYCKLAHGVNMSLESREFRALFRENCC